MRVLSKLSAGLMAGAVMIAGVAASAQSTVQAAGQNQLSADYASPANPANSPSVAPAIIPQASAPIASAQAIRSLNIMLMVTSLRCRAGAHDFRSEYDMFARAHQQNLQDAHNELTGEMAAAFGEEGSHRALDRIGVSIANRYGDGHPTMGCSDLKEATLELAMSQDRTQLALMAGRLLMGKRPTTAIPATRPTIVAEWEGAEHNVVVPPSASRQNHAKGNPSAIGTQPPTERPSETEQSVSPRVPNWLRG